MNPATVKATTATTKALLTDLLEELDFEQPFTPSCTSNRDPHRSRFPFYHSGTFWTQ
ncbi:hypothetical protein AHF37_02214 [Paragonimus kellicotti]|nr:hypothetical protein AHF37_02214 [Paragonimus kellicotti]